jgi:uncharacterized damage-inducible protein DinB
MESTARLTAELKENFEGEPWHGTSLRRLLDDVTEEQAYARPIANARTIAELLAHTIAWMDIVERRLRGEEFEVTPELDFPSTEGTTWSELLARAEAAHAHLLAAVGALRDADWERRVAGKPYNLVYMLRGLTQHNTYHAAQIAMLKKF